MGFSKIGLVWVYLRGRVDDGEIKGFLSSINDQLGIYIYSGVRLGGVWDV